MSTVVRRIADHSQPDRGAAAVESVSGHAAGGGGGMTLPPFIEIVPTIFESWAQSQMT
jgi:hypothetical protein